MSGNASYQITTSAISCWPFLYKELVLLTLRKVGADHISFHNCHIFLAIFIGQLSAKSLRLRQLEQYNTSVHIGRGHEQLQAGARSELLERPLRAQAADHRGGSEGTPGGAGVRTRASGPSSTASLQIRVRRCILVCEMTTSLPAPTTSQGEDQVGLCE